MSRTPNRERVQRELEALLDVLHVEGRPWMTTLQVAAPTPWSSRTVIDRLDKLLGQGLVEKERGYPCRWRLA